MSFFSCTTHLSWFCMLFLWYIYGWSSVGCRTNKQSTPAHWITTLSHTRKHWRQTISISTLIFMIHTTHICWGMTLKCVGNTHAQTHDSLSPHTQSGGHSSMQWLCCTCLFICAPCHFESSSSGLWRCVRPNNKLWGYICVLTSAQAGGGGTLRNRET